MVRDGDGNSNHDRWQLQWGSTALAMAVTRMAAPVAWNLTQKMIDQRRLWRRWGRRSVVIDPSLDNSHDGTLNGRNKAAGGEMGR